MRSNKALRFNDEIEVRQLPHKQGERYTGDFPWRIKQKSGIDIATKNPCECTSKLQNIDPTLPSLQEQESRTKTLETAERNARIRAVQLHLQVVSDFPALPAILRCCATLPAMRASVKLHHLTTDEADREWIYDTGAGLCFISEAYFYS